MAAYRAGAKTVIFPKENIADLDEVDDVVKNNINFIPAENISTVLENALAGKPRNTKRAQRKIIRADASITG